jgi:hypothetical protein
MFRFSTLATVSMADREPFTIEILGFDHDHAVTVDRVIGGSRDLEEAKRIGHHLFCIADEGTRPEGYRVLSDGREVFAWHSPTGSLSLH